MRAAVFKDFGKPFEIEEVPDPEPGEGEAIIKVERCGVCGSDLHMTTEHSPWVRPGMVIGHEYAGEVVAVGKGVEHVKIGDRVTAMPLRGCGHCANCTAGFPSGCDSMTGYIGGYAEYMRIPDSSALILPKSLSMSDGALIEPLAVGLRGVASAKFEPGAKVAVLGSGSVGLATIYWARLLGAGPICAISRSKRREASALAMGADTFEALGEDEVERISAALGGMPDVVFECAGAVGLTQKAVELVRPGGTIISLGFCSVGDPVIPAIATWKRVTIHFSFCYTEQDFEHAIRTFDRGHVEARDMVSSTVSFDSFPAVFEALRTGTADEIKVHLDPWADS